MCVKLPINRITINPPYDKISNINISMFNPTPIVLSKENNNSNNICFRIKKDLKNKRKK